MHEQVKRLKAIKLKIKEILEEKQLKNYNPKIIAVSKTFEESTIYPIIESGHNHFGENKIQEAEKKWINIKEKFPNIQLHMLGKLQSNKVKKAIQLFEFIHSLDSYKVAEKIYKFQKELNKKINIFIQVNLGNEEQKSGIPIDQVSKFYDFCFKKLELNIIGLMCIPPQNENSQKYFILLKETLKKLDLKESSMGMSNDYIEAVNYGATFLRLGTAIFGDRKSNE